MKEVVPTVVPDSLEAIVETSERYAPFTSRFHIDATDGHFAPYTTWFPKEGDTLPPRFSYEVHLMVDDPHTAGVAFAKAGADCVIGHLEAFPDISAALAMFAAWREAGAQDVGVAVLLQTPLEALEPYLRECNRILFMTIARIGVQGIPFEATGIARVAEFHLMHPDVAIAVDGGVSEKNIEALARAGARYFSVGSAIAQSPDPAATYQHLLSLAEGV